MENRLQKVFRSRAVCPGSGPGCLPHRLTVGHLIPADLTGLVIATLIAVSGADESNCAGFEPGWMPSCCQSTGKSTGTGVSLH